MLIDCSYFMAGRRHIQNASLGRMPNPNAIEVNNAIESYIESYQEVFLIRMLGPVVGQKVQDYLTNSGNGDACIEAVCERLKESFADYVFYRIVQENNTQATITGLVRLKCANEYVSPIRRQVIVWNTMVERNRIFAEWCRSSDCAVSGIEISSAMLTKIKSINI